MESAPMMRRVFPLARWLVPPSWRRWVQIVLRRPLTLLYRGDRVECPCCRGRFRKFMPAGTPPRANAACPRCGSRERHRLLYLFVQERARLLRGQIRLLHLAPEAALDTLLQRQQGIQYVTADLLDPKVMVRFDLCAIPFSDSTLDAFICSHVLEHVLDDRGAVRELKRVLRPGGWAKLRNVAAAALNMRSIWSARRRMKALVSGSRSAVNLPPPGLVSAPCSY